MLPLASQAQSLGDLKKQMPTDAMESATQTMSGSLSSMLQGQLGIYQDQAEGGIGSILTLASENSLLEISTNWPG